MTPDAPEDGLALTLYQDNGPAFGARPASAVVVNGATYVPAEKVAEAVVEERARIVAYLLAKQKDVREYAEEVEDDDLARDARSRSDVYGLASIFIERGEHLS